jgi:hypothetical protein
MEDQETSGTKILTLIPGMDRYVGKWIERWAERYRDTWADRLTVNW